MRGRKPKPDDERLEQVSGYVPPSIKQDVAAVTKIRGWYESQLVRRAVEEFVEREKQELGLPTAA